MCITKEVLTCRYCKRESIGPKFNTCFVKRNTPIALISQADSAAKINDATAVYRITHVGGRKFVDSPVRSIHGRRAIHENKQLTGGRSNLSLF